MSRLNMIHFFLIVIVFAVWKIITVSAQIDPRYFADSYGPSLDENPDYES